MDMLTSEIETFYLLAKQRHRRINPCFMTGKGCVHTEHIDIELEERNRKQNQLKGFMVRPFRPNVEAFNKLCLERYLQSNYAYIEKGLKLEQADKIRRTGYVVCEKICRRVQSVDFIIVDVSTPNANVFYELGLAYGIAQKIVVIHQESSKFGKLVANYLEDAGCKAYPYKDLSPIKQSDFMLSQYLWYSIEDDASRNNTKPSILLLSQQYGFLSNASQNANFQNPGYSANEKNKDHVDNLVGQLLGPQDIGLDFETHVKAAIGVAIANIVSDLQQKNVRSSIPTPYIKLIKGLQSPEEVKREASFHEVRQQLEKAYCTIIHTGGENAEPLAYFWLGYCHAKGKNVIPVTVVKSPKDSINDLAFDIRALWHMTFLKSNPTKFAKELQDTIHQMIISDFSEWSRNSFWDTVLDRRGRVSIFSGALHNDPIGRDMIGDWDLRAASELTSYFASHQYRATIESPVYQIEQFTKKRLHRKSVIQKEDYINALGDMLKGKNCIIIASPDVNPLTEVLLGKLYGINSEKWFTDFNAEDTQAAVVSFKESVIKKRINKKAQSISDNKNNQGRIFYHQLLVELNEEREEKKRLKRGFKGHGVPQKNLSGEFLSQKDDMASFTVHAHLVIAKNPFDPPESEKHHIVILNGVSGPATFALTHVLTGGTSSQFVAYSGDFDPNSRSEAFLQQVNDDIEMLKENRVRGVQYFIKVKVGPPIKEKGTVERHIFDWRRILQWERSGSTPGLIYSHTTSGRTQ